MLLKDKHVVVTGSDGFVGRYLVKQLKDREAKVVPFDIAEGRDITRWSDFSGLTKADIVFHLAARTFVPTSQENPRLTYEVNLTGTANVLEMCRVTGARMIFASSYVYGNPQYLPTDEKHPVNPTNTYARSKVLGEQLCRAYHEDHDVPCVILRPFNIFGPGQDESFLIPEIVKQLKVGDVLTLQDLKPRRDLLYVSDAVDAYIKAGEYDATNYEIFNIGYGESFSVEDVAKKLIELTGNDVELRSLRVERPGAINDTVADTRKAKELLKWQPTVDLVTGLKDTLNA